MLLESFRNQRLSLFEWIYIVLTSLFVAMLLLTNIVTSKYIRLGSFMVTGGAIVYPFTFLLADVITELYGKRRAQWVVGVGLWASLGMVFVTYLANRLPIYSGSPLSQQVFSKVFGFTPGIVLGSMVAYMAGQWVDIYLFAWVCRLTKGRYLWLRNVSSTLVGQALDTLIFSVFAWVVWPLLYKGARLSLISWDTWYQLSVYEYGVKVVWVVLNVPMVYGACYLIRWLEKRARR